MTTSAQASFSVDLPHPADSLSVLHGQSWEPLALACGTYRLIEGNPQRRIGTVLLYQFDEDGLKQLSTLDTAGILDLHWATNADNSPFLLTADAEGNLNLHDLTPPDFHLGPPSSVVNCSPTALALSLSLQGSYKGTTPSLGPTLVSLSNGEISHVIVKDGKLELAQQWKAHEHEVWYVTWGHEPSVLYSGSDDLTLKGWDLRIGTDSPTFVTRRFDGGIVSIVPSPWDEHQIAVGTYDSLVRIYDTRSPARPLASHPVAGGAWRLSYHPSPTRRDHLLVAAMHGGAEVLDLSLPAGEEVQARFEGHQSMCYGAQWITADRGVGQDRVASCSFYDQKLCLWRG
ncbi:WD40 repeat-like protein [Calocera cornea HHB12733]|uniref:methylated diphthine methylhydrolase n=1 Tax=Calocera cornea HHB12733 TaxID=1353952 RepID=A0A165IQM1_9BASI|nr:WD40 repeat-like protein [Calocera cornea HHB12733]